MKISVVVPCYNTGSYLPECIASLLVQGLESTSYEIIIVDDESTDDTLEIARDLAREHEAIRVISRKNGGVGAARNSGLDAARGEYVYFIDSDDYLAERALGVLLDAALDENLDLITFDTKLVSDGGHRTSANAMEGVQEVRVEDGISRLARTDYQNKSCLYLIRREFVERAGVRFVEGKWLEDAIFTAELFCAVKRMSYAGLDVHRYRIIASSAMHNKDPVHYRKVTFDMADVVHALDRLVATVPENHENARACIERLKAKQQFFVFFVMARLMKLKVPEAELSATLDGFKEIGAYPLDRFPGAEHRRAVYSPLAFLFNRERLFRSAVKVSGQLRGLSR